MNSAQVIQIFLLALCLNALSVLTESVPNTMKKNQSFIDLPDGLLLGAGTSAAQIEGASTTNGKSESYINWLMHKYFKNVSADVASDSYHKYKEDIEVLKYTKLNVYRFSMSWPRLLPTGYANHVNEDGVRYYHAVLDELERIGVEPLVLLHHFDHPAVLEKSNVWENGEIVELFTNYSRFVFQEFGSRIKNFVTFNEPNEFCHKLISKFSENQNSEPKRMAIAYACGHNALKAHAQVHHMYHNEFNPRRKGKLSINIKCENYFPKNESDRISAEVAFQFQCGWLAHPIYSKSGDYHNIVKQWVQENSFAENLTVSRLPTFSDEWIQKIKGSSDYFGLSHYSSHLVEPAPQDDPESWVSPKLRLSLISDSRLLTSESPGCDAAANGLCVMPEGFRNVLRKISKEYDHPVIYVLENGYSNDGSLNDINRINYINSYLSEVIKSIKYDNIDIKLYIYWSLIDCFEYTENYNVRFGLVHVNITNDNRTRTLRQSATWLRNVIETKKLQTNA